MNKTARASRGLVGRDIHKRYLDLSFQPTWFLDVFGFLPILQHIDIATRLNGELFPRMTSFVS